MFDGVNNRPALVGVLATKYEIASACSMPEPPRERHFDIARAPHLGKTGFVLLVHVSEPRSAR